MKDLLLLPEPKLIFAHNQAIEHPKDGLFLFGPPSDHAQPIDMRFGIVGTATGIKRFRVWMERVRHYLPPVKDDVPHHAAFPGFTAVFQARWPERPIVEVVVDGDTIQKTIRIENPHEGVFETVAIYLEAIRTNLRQGDARPEFWYVIVPEEIHTYGRPKSQVPKSEREPAKIKMTEARARNLQVQSSLLQEDYDDAEIFRYERNFHHQLKARLLENNVVVQVVRETTLAPNEFKVGNRLLRTVQDPATIAWNLLTTSYFKATGKPWKLAGVREGVCYVGIVFKKQNTELQDRQACCGAQMFLDSGDGLVFKGAVGPWYVEDSKEYHLSREKARELIELVVGHYRKMHDKPPNELFIHGRARFSNDEWLGFEDAVRTEKDINLAGIRIIRPSNLKLFRLGSHPVPRGTAYILNPGIAYLWTVGYVPRLATYPGWEVPNPLLIDINRGNADIETTLRDILGLTKLNYNGCNFADSYPVTLKFANAVGDILTAAPVKPGSPWPFRHYI
jgi:hypothetical protein